MLLIVEKIEVKNNTTYLTCLTTEHKKQVRCNSSRFSWKVTTLAEESAERAEAKMKADVLKETAVIREQFSFKDHMRLSFYPRIIEATVWKYVDKVIDYCVQNRVDVFKKLTRAAREFRKEYDNEVAKDLKFEFRQKIQHQADLWQKACTTDFIQMQYTVSNVLLRAYKQVPDFIINAYLARKLIELRRSHDAEMNSLLEQKLGYHSPSLEMKPITKLYNLLEGWLPEMDEIKKVDKDLNITIGMKVLKNKLSLIEWGD